MDRTISVIVPVYNVKLYLLQCIDSILNQSYHKLQIVLIDDGSTDGSGELCDEMAKKDSRIQVIHQSNLGAAHARNAGMQVATGEYLSFVDSDDYLERDAYLFMVRKLEKYDADVVRCSFREVWKNRVGDERLADSEERIYSAEEFLGKFTEDWTCGLLWDKLYRRILFEGITFEEGHKIDDEFFTYQGIMNARRILSVPKVVYNYRKRVSGIMTQPESMEQIILDKLDYASVRRRNVSMKYPALKQIYDEHYSNFLLLLIRDPYATGKSLMKTKKQIIRFLAERPKISVKIKWQLFCAICIRMNRLMRKNSIHVEKDLADYFE